MSLHLERAWRLYELSRYKMAIEELHQVLVYSPQDAEAYALWALCSSKLRHHQEAIKLAKEAIAIAPN